MSDLERPIWSRLAVRCLGALAATCLFVSMSAAGTLPRDKDPLVQDMDTSVKPGVDFFEYANGGWLKTHPIPASERGWGIGNLVQEETYAQRRDICTDAAASGAKPGSIEQKIGDYWIAGMDSMRIEKQGAAPLKPWLDKIDAIKTRDDLLAEIADFQHHGIGALYSVYVGQDERNSDKYMVHLSQGGIGMPDRDYYFGADSSTRHVRAEYQKHLVAMFKLLGENPTVAQQSSATVMRIETELARRSRKLEDLRDPWANYHKMPIGALSKRTPALDWSKHFTAMGVPKVDTVIVGQPEFFAAVDSELTATPIAAWKTYLRWNLVNSLANRMSRPFEQEDFHFYSTVLSGIKTMRPRWKRVIDAEEGAIGDLLGQAWVKRYCSPATRARYVKLTADIIEAYRERIRALPWMSEATKKRALVKLDHVNRKVGYPDKWRDYSALQLDRSSWVGDQINVNEWWFRYYADKLGKPIDREVWDMTPQTYNAYYDGSKVEIVLPAAGFLIPGVPDSLVDDALLYSYAGGSTIGHEITHGFDDEGRQFDERGNLNPWWTPQDSVEFTKRADKLAKQFDQYKIGDKHVRGKATLGENIADLGGVRLGYEAFKKTEQWKKGQSINGLTPDQRYFLGYALSWLDHRRTEALTAQIMSNVHAPAQFRVIGPLSNIPEFYKAFGIKPGDPMYRSDDVRVAIW